MLGTELTAPPFTRATWAPGLEHPTGENTAMEHAWTSLWMRQGGYRGYPEHLQSTVRMSARIRWGGVKRSRLSSASTTALSSLVPEIKQTSDLTTTAHFLHLILTELSLYAEFCNSHINITLQLPKSRGTNLHSAVVVQIRASSRQHFQDIPPYFCTIAEKEQQSRSLTESPISKSTM